MQGGEGADRALGMFINTLPLRANLSGLDVRTAVAQMHASLSELLVHEHASLAMAQRCSRIAAPTPLFSALLNYRHSVASDAVTQDIPWQGIEALSAEERSNYPLTLSVDDLGAGFLLKAQVEPAVGAQRLCAYMQVALIQLVDALDHADDRSITQLGVLPDAERQHVLGFNPARMPAVPQLTIAAMVEQHAAGTPDAVAVECGSEQVTYAALNAQANALARHLIALGVEPDMRVAICVQRSPALLVGLLAILKAGAAYVPLDPGYPSQRLRYLLQDSAPQAVLVHAATHDALGAEVLSGLALPVIDIGSLATTDHATTNPVVAELTPAHLAYVIYTSGSTGEPKGVMVEHRQLAQLIAWHCTSFGVQAGVRTSSVAGLSFDAAAWEIWPTLCAGGCLLMPDGEAAGDMEGVLQWWQAQELDVSFLPTPMAEHAFASKRMPKQLKHLLVGGDRLRQVPAGLPFAVHNNYGPTETTVVATSGEVMPEVLSPSIGAPLPHLRAYVLDAQRQLLPQGVVGELYLGGAGVARGYLGREALTAERFLADPFHPGERMYRTGDLCRWSADGRLQYVGRNDAQVKIRGRRIELGEIEAHLQAHPQVREAVVLVREEMPGDQQLVAYLIAQEHQSVPTAEDLRAQLQRSLADYMVPSAFVLLQTWPLTRNGKLDRKALPAPQTDDYAHQRYEAPQGAVEQTLAEIWQAVLGVERVGRHDNFFQLGGHSLLAVTLIERMRWQGLVADVRVLFGQPTLAALAAAVGTDQAIEVPANRIPPGCRHITPELLPLVELPQDAIDRIVARVPGGHANVQDIYPLAPLQEGVLYHHLAARQGDPYLLHAQFGFADRSRLQAFVDALQIVIDRHDILRTAVFWEGLDQPVQVVVRGARLPVEEIVLDPAQGEIVEQLRARFDPRHYRLELGDAPLLRLVIADDPANQRLLGTLLFHHVVLDHTALEVVGQEMQAVFAGTLERLPAAIPYRNYVAQVCLGDAPASHTAFFTRMLGDVDEPTLPFGLQDVQGDGSGIEQAELRLDAALSVRLRAQARKAGISVASLHHLAYARVLGVLSGRDDVVFGTVLMGRMQGGEGADRALGMFINTLPLRVNLLGLDVRTAVANTHAGLSELLVHEHASLATAQRCSGIAAPTPLFSALLNYRHSPANDALVPDVSLHGIEMLSGEERSNYPLTLSVDDLGEGFLLKAQVEPAVGAQRLCAYMQVALIQLVDALDHADDRSITQLRVLPDAERQHVLGFNPARMPAVPQLTIAAMVEQHAAGTPDAVAVECGSEQVTYAALNAQANALARHLIALGVEPDMRVAICVQRSPALLVGLLAILKAGAAYVPLDPGYPSQRLRYLLQDSAPQAVLVHAATHDALGAEVLSGLALPVIDIGSLATTDHATTNPVVAELTPAHLAYVIYTSGSTGEPKGVMVEHRQLAQLIAWHCTSFGVQAGVRTSSVAGLSFDAAAWEIWPTLCAGGCLLMPDGEAAGDMEGVLQWWQAQELDVSFLPTPMAEHAFASKRMPKQLKHLLVGGDRLRQVPAGLPFAVHNNYGPTETTVVATSGEVMPEVLSPSIGAPLPHLRAYVLDAQRQLLPQGVVGELYLGGAGVARGYLGRDALTAERFLADPFHPGERMYRTGDLCRWSADGRLHYVGRNDAQVKIRGRRIELGEIEAHLQAHPQVREAVVLVRDDVPGDQQLVAYLIAQEHQSVPTAEDLRAQLQRSLADYMVPSAFVLLQTWPLTRNGKLDRKALPAPQTDDYAHQRYEAPQGAVEQTLAEIWQAVLGVERVGRHDNFFQLGGHSLLAVTLIERMRRQGLVADVRVLFGQPTLAALAAALGTDQAIEVPANRIPPGCRHITPELLPLVELPQDAIDRIVASVPGGVANVQDIYPLAPLQEGVLYHHLAARQGDPYLQSVQYSFDSRERLDHFAQALQQVIDRHDVLRTSVVWEGLDAPVQVVWRQAPLSVVPFQPELADVDAISQLQSHLDPVRYRLDLSIAPLLQLHCVHDAACDAWEAVLLIHHLVYDAATLHVLHAELHACMSGHGDRLEPSVPYRNYVAQARLDGPQAEREAFFRQSLGDFEVPSLPYGLQDIHGDGRPAGQAVHTLEVELCGRLRTCAAALGVTPSSLYHLAWAQVLGQLSASEDVVFGTVLLGRMHAGLGADRAIGMFVNTLPVRVRMGRQTVREAVNAVHAQLSDLLSHEHAALSEVQRCSGVTPPSPLFTALLNYRSQQHGGAERSAAWPGIEMQTTLRSNHYPVVLEVEETDAGVQLVGHLPAGFDAASLCIYMQVALTQLVEALARPDECPLHAVSILQDAERRQLLQDFNATTRAYPKTQTIHALFEQHAVAQPDAIAVRDGLQHYSYASLNRCANQLAHYLIGSGVQPGDHVAIALPRSFELIVAQLAISKCAAAYLPLDIQAPPGRLHAMVEDSGARWVVTDRDQPLPAGIARLDLDSLGLATMGEHNPALLQTSHDVAYLMYTSGSTGVPKGVRVPHRAIVRLVCNNGYAEFAASDRVAFAANPAFDASTLEVWAPLLNGGCVVVVEQDVLLAPERLLLHLQEEQVTVLWLTAGLFHQYASTLLPAFAQLRYLIVGGDVLDPAVVARVLQHAAPQVFLNGYGPTETTTFATTHRITQAPTSGIPIGKPIGNTQAYVLDVHRRPVPLGVVGELYIGGDGVALGYLNRPGLTAERFVPDPFSADANARLYRTGDLVRWQADGTLLFAGRDDGQVKIRGFRVELGEIETALRTCPGIRAAAVIQREDASGSRQLVAYYCVDASLTGDIDAAVLRRHLQTQLMDYMLPAAYVALPQLPLTANGKLDRRALPAPELDAHAHQQYAAPQGERERALAEVWQSVLGVERVGRHDNFFQLGGHSLLAVTLVERLRQQGIATDVRTLFERPDLASLASAVGQVQQSDVPPNRIAPGCARITPSLLPLLELSQEAIDTLVATVPGGAPNVQDIYPLTPLQEGVLYHHLAARQGDPYLLQTRFAFDDDERLRTFVDLLRHVVDRHDILRTSVVWEGVLAPVQIVWRHAPLICEQVAVDATGGDVLTQLQTRFDSRRYRLDLGQAPLLRLFHARDPHNGRIVVLLLFHHLALDHTALAVVQQEMQALAEAADARLPTPVPYRNYVVQALRGKTAAEHEAYFRQCLGDLDVPTLAFSGHDGSVSDEPPQQSDGVLDAALALRLRQQARRLQLSVASLYHLAWGMVLGAGVGREDIVFGTVLLGRMQGSAHADRALGMFINTLPIRLRLDVPAVAAARRTQVALSALMAHEHAALSLAQRCSGVAASLPLFNALLNYRHSATSTEVSATSDVWEGMQALGSSERTHYPLLLNVDDLGEQFALSVQAGAHIGAERVRRFMQVALERLVDALEHGSNIPVRQLCVLPDDERRQVLGNFNASARAYPSAQTVHSLVEQQAARTPEALAVIDGRQRCDYAELNRRANQLAHHLIGAGVRPGDHVAICLPRSLELVVAQLAISKCAAAYLPLDAQAPPERFQRMLDDSAARCVITRSEQPLAVAIARLDLDHCDLRAAPTHDPRLPQSSESAAYLMYTSGSTGLPKGVRIPHRAISRLVCNNGYAQFLPSDRVAFAANPAFDASTLEVWAPLLNGGCVVVIAQESVLSPRRLRDRLQQEAVSVLWLTAGLFHHAAAELLPVFPQLRYLIVGGDVLDPAVVAQVLAEGAPQVLLNGYGPTESTTFATTHRITEVSGPIPIGRPVGNTQTYVLDAHGLPLPIGVAGELFIGGDGLALGYVNQPSLTAERFVPDPFSGKPGARLYRTGDLVRWRHDGVLEYLGRNDGQVKVRGFRVELGEIESALRQYPAIASAAVVQREDAPAAKQLVAYYCVDEVAAGDVDARALRAHLRACLPDYMLPAAYVRLPQLPLTANGKLDRQALPMPGRADHAVDGDVPPQGELERLLAGLWSKLLGVERIGRYDDFHALGGHSLALVRLGSLLERAGRSVPLSTLSLHPTLAAMAEAIARERQQSSPADVVTVRSASDRRPLFLVHDFTGLDLYFAPLATHIAADVPIHGLTAVALDAPQLQTVQELATRLLENLRKVQAHGPYRVAGWSFGGLLAYEIATQLIANDEIVEFVGLIDTYHPAHLDLGPEYADPLLAVRRLLLRNCLSALPQDARHASAVANLQALAAQVHQWEAPALLQLCRSREWLPPQWSGQDDVTILRALARQAAHGHAHRHYVPIPINASVHLFAATELLPQQPVSDPLPGWQALLAPHALGCERVAGNHHTMLQAPHVAALGAAVSQRLAVAEKAPPRRQPRHEPLVRLQVDAGARAPLVCVPGAGDNVTGFIGLAAALDDGWPVYGLQPRGLESGQVPYGSVEVAARAYVEALAQTAQRPIHLLGHSFGGWIAFEMARQLEARGRAVASLTLLDCEVPGGDGVVGRPHTATGVFEHLIQSLELAGGASLGIDIDAFRLLDNTAQLQAVHAGMVRTGLLPRRAPSEAIRGMVQVFGSALRTCYRPTWRYPGTLHLAVADDPRHDAMRNRLEHDAQAAGWRALATDVQVWHAPGDHFTMLRAPHVRALADWWTQTVVQDTDTRHSLEVQA
ncbi:non-ribosomal peptide synthetase [Xanthomonas campestris]|uniref:non-ribosomal peptide synthetase n=1 Tax=Xanthomonas campestris TaxID=339 RepID=UPI001E404726|nr:non-ribosomal peptide synthetase [Xanthomonas campestris]MCC4605961.1 amino acid adenylation domain-containing protein [Xanthomonas campestris pv. parthenii]